MASRGESKRQRLDAFLAETGTQLIDEEVLERLAVALAPISEKYLRRLLKDTGIAMSPLVEGVSQHSFVDLERTLLALQGRYETVGRGDQRKLRSLVVTAKDHARWTLRKPGIPEETQRGKEEILLWLLTWLENPAVFPAWVAIRKRLLNLD